MHPLREPPRARPPRSPPHPTWPPPRPCSPPPQRRARGPKAHVIGGGSSYKYLLRVLGPTGNARSKRPVTMMSEAILGKYQSPWTGPKHPATIASVKNCIQREYACSAAHVECRYGALLALFYGKAERRLRT